MMLVTPPSNGEFLATVLPHLRKVRGPDRHGEHVCWCPFHADGQGTPPHQPNLHVSERGFFCHACGAKGGLKELAQRLTIEVSGSPARLEMTYDYLDEKNELLFQVVRKPGKQFRQRRPDGRGGWIWNLKGVRRALYRLPELLAHPSEIVLVTEGEKDADRLHREGLQATTNPGGAGKWKDEYCESLRGRDVVILPDNDDTGQKHGESVARSLSGVAKVVKVVRLPGLAEKGDVSDWLASGHTVEALLDLVKKAPAWERADAMEEGQPTKRASQADLLVRLVEEVGFDLFHDPVDTGYARVPVLEHHEILRCRSQAFRRWLARQFWFRHKKVPHSQALQSAIQIIEANACFDGPEYELFNRVASRNGALWFDLTDPQWRAVRITAQGWEVVAAPPILFRRHSHQRPQCEPCRGGDLWRFLPFVNLKDPSQGLLLLVYLVSALIPDIPHPIPVAWGSQGAAKTTLFRMLRRLIDPSATETLSLPRDFAGLVQQLSHQWAPFYDNLSYLPDWVSDAFCRAITGDGISKRELYSDDDDVIYQFRRCLGLNGINVAGHKPDLLDRCLLFGLDTIQKERRRPERELWATFEEARPALLGAMFDTLSLALEGRPSIQIAGLPRMADFTLWGSAIAQALGRTQEAFLEAYETNMRTRNEEVIVANPVALAVTVLLREAATWEGTPSELLEALDGVAVRERINQKARAWPKGPQALSRRLNEVRPNLLAAGIQVETSHARDRIVRLITTNPQNTVDSVDTVASFATHSEQESSRKASCDDTATVTTIPSHRRPLSSKPFDDNDGIDGIPGSLSNGGSHDP